MTDVQGEFEKFMAEHFAGEPTTLARKIWEAGRAAGQRDMRERAARVAEEKSIVDWPTTGAIGRAIRALEESK